MITASVITVIILVLTAISMSTSGVTSLLNFTSVMIGLAMIKYSNTH